MPGYTAPVGEMRYLLGEVFADEAREAGIGGEAMPLDLAEAILHEAGQFCASVLQPLNRVGDEQGCRLENGVVRTPDGFAAAYAAFVDGGWGGLSGPAAQGGQGLPRVMQLLLDEMLASANFAFGLFPGLTRGAAECLARHGDAALVDAFLPNLVSGRWTGAMALTEAHAGTDLGLLRTRAEPAEDGSYRLTGEKIFITAGDHDLAENVIHLVLARLPDAPAGTRGISLFLVPKFLPDAQACPGARNALSVGGLERKMGIHGSPTCTIRYEAARGWLVGPPHRGLAAMFTMMNTERLFVGVQGLGIAEAAYQGAADYARTRLQGRGPGAAGEGPQPILAHPDVRRMLLTMRALAEGGRALAVWAGLAMDRKEGEAVAAFLTPVIKAGLSDLGFEAAVLGQQVLGGHGYVRDWGMEQLVRDARIAQIYEGTNGVQALDLVTRKLPAEGGAAARALEAAMAAALADLPAGSGLRAPFADSLAAWRRATEWLAGKAATADGAASASAYLRLTALVAIGWMWARMAATPGASASKPHLAAFYMQHMLPQAAALSSSIVAGADSVMALPASAF